jgi:DNA-directed RNA polymerase subunit N (RpoN/RPB10)
MIIPVRCFTCGKVLGDKWQQYTELKSKYKNSDEDTIINLKNVKKTAEGKAMDELNIKRICCRRIMLGQLDLIDII